MSLDSAFNSIFRRKLCNFDFIKLKGICGFGRLVNNEIFQYISFHGSGSTLKGMKAFTMLAGIHTIYSKPLTKPRILATATNFKAFSSLDAERVSIEPSVNYYSYDDSSIENAVFQAASDTVEFLKRRFEGINDIDSYINLCKYVFPARLTFADRLNNDSLLLIKSSNHDSFDDVIECRIRRKSSLPSANNMSENDFEELKRKTYSEIKNSIVLPRDNVYDNPDLLRAVNEELNRRRKENCALLRTYEIHTNL